MGPLGVKSIVNKLSWVAAPAAPAAAGNYRLASQLPRMGAAPTWATWATSQPLHCHCSPWRLSLRLGPGPIHSPTEEQGQSQSPSHTSQQFGKLINLSLGALDCSRLAGQELTVWKRDRPVREDPKTLW